MTFVFDIGHPAHVHYFKNIIARLKRDGHDIIVFARDKECTHQLLDAYGIPYISRGKGSSNLIGKLYHIFIIDLFMTLALLGKKKDIFIGFASPYSAHVAWLYRKTSITIDDTDKAALSHKLYLPFTSIVVTPSVFKKEMGKKQIKFKSFMELSYLHPDVFEPNPAVLKDLGISEGEKFAILRFVSWGANHDVGHAGMQEDQKRKVMELIQKKYKVFISSESNLPPDLLPFKLNIPVESLHDCLAYAELYIGEGATMAAEAAMLGVPAIYTNSLTAGTLQAMSDYGLLHIWNPEKENLEDLTELFLKESNGKRLQQEKRQKMLQDCNNPTKFFLELIQN
jgi:predicted glycosyltransferase